jgi:hypothetical protein
MVCSKVTVKITIGLINVAFGNFLMKKALILPPQHRFDAPGVKRCGKHHEHVS